MNNERNIICYYRKKQCYVEATATLERNCGKITEFEEKVLVLG